MTCLTHPREIVRVWRARASFSPISIKDWMPNPKTANGRPIQLGKLLGVIAGIVERPKPSDSRPTYDRMDLALNVERAAQNFHNGWWPRLGLSLEPGVVKEHARS